jgi:lycopene beta-cyclase
VPGPDLDVAIVGDGPAGMALAAACRELGIAAIVLGRGEPWTATYGTWRDDVAHLPDDVFASITPRVVVVGERHHDIARPYGVFDGARLRDLLSRDVQRRTATVDGVQHFVWGSRALTDAGAVDARLVVDATGTGHLLAGGQLRRPAAWQTAYGVVFDGVGGLTRIEPGVVTLMDWRPPPGSIEDAVGIAGVPATFCYVVPVADGWLVEETVLAADPAVDPEALRARLAARLGGTGVLDRRGGRVERVRIPMGVAPPSRLDPVVAFGAAAGYVHPATGYSVAASLRAAPRVARAIADGRSAAHVHDAVWPPAHRRARVLHDYGLAALARLDAAGTRAFFDAFFELPPAEWAAYLRVDTTPRAVSSVMTSVFRSAPWPVRRRLLAGNPLALVRLLQPR